MNWISNKQALEKQKGFTLAELAVVLVIVGLLLGGLMVPLSAQYDSRYVNDTQKSLNDIRDALIGFAIVNGRLPCPADRTVGSGTSAGVEAVTASGGPCKCTTASSGVAVATGGTACNDTSPNSVGGILPWATLGLPETDAWGNRYTYRITTRFGRKASGQTSFGCTPGSNPNSAAFALCSTGDIIIYTSSALTTTVASGIPAIVVSHGKNGYGAWNTGGSQNDYSSATADEQENANSGVNFVSNTSIDDQLIWISPNLLMNRMIAAGKLP